MRYLLSICSVAFALVGCTRTATMSWREFNAGVISKHPDDLIWYCGSKDGYDCFRLVSLNAIIVSYLQKRQSRAVTRFPLIAPHG